MDDKLSAACEKLALKLMFTSTGIKVSDLPSIFKDIGVQYRKSKSEEDIRSAIRKGMKAGMFKTECEISMVSLYLSKVVKLA